MRTPKITEDAKELINLFASVSINFPYLDTEDGQCIGSGYMVYNSAAKCALICAKKCREQILNFDNGMQWYWDEVIAEIESLLY